MLGKGGKGSGKERKGRYWAGRGKDDMVRVAKVLGEMEEALLGERLNLGS